MTRRCGAAEMPKELAGIYWAKNMYWRAGRPERFVRPVRWMVAILGAETVPVEFGGYVAGKVTYGHRVLFGEQEIRVSAPGAYEGALRDVFVIADVEVRRQTIRKALDKVCRGIEGARWREDHALVDKLTHLTEWASERSVRRWRSYSTDLMLGCSRMTRWCPLGQRSPLGLS